MQVDANSGGKIECPVCSYKIDDIQREINKSRLVADDKISVIKYEGKNDSFVWKHPIEDFNWGSQLIVHESQEAIFMMNGRALDLFGPGRYTLETENLPLIGRVVDAPTGGQIRSMRKSISLIKLTSPQSNGERIQEYDSSNPKQKFLLTLVHMANLHFRFQIHVNC